MNPAIEEKVRIRLMEAHYCESCGVTLPAGSPAMRTPGGWIECVVHPDEKRENHD